ncbi:hypothetical protein KYY02_17125 [Streptomyces pimonensis]|uniref:Uncharacterized protein n=1 Tax=Streptomyces pimonensis TaxID=2860288 RepID=A0ABV4J098_9ACTN
MSADIYGGITVDLHDAPIRCEYDRDIDGKQMARLVIGEPGKSLAITVTNSSPDTVAELAEAVAQLAAWTKRQNLREVA